MSRIKIFTGHFGSGKTEIAINYALDIAKKGEKVTIVDLDIVNPYFCVRELKDKLEKEGVRVITSNPEYVNAELMVVPSDVISIFNEDIGQVIIDVGGDGDGAIVLGQYNKYFLKEEYSMYFVINNNRPLTMDSKSTEEYIRDIETKSRLKITDLISNTNMSYETSVEDIIKGHEQTRELSKKLNIPYNYAVCKKDLVEEVQRKIDNKIYGIDIFMKPPWRK